MRFMGPLAHALMNNRARGGSSCPARSSWGEAPVPASHCTSAIDSADWAGTFPTAGAEGDDTLGGDQQRAAAAALAAYREGAGGVDADSAADAAALGSHQHLSMSTDFYRTMQQGGMQLPLPSTREELLAEAAGDAASGAAGGMAGTSGRGLAAGDKAGSNSGGAAHFTYTVSATTPLVETLRPLGSRRGGSEPGAAGVVQGHSVEARRATVGGGSGGGGSVAASYSRSSLEAAGRAVPVAWPEDAGERGMRLYERLGG